jgi:hypothetical protein
MLFFSPTEHFAVEVIVFFKGRIIFKQYIPKKHKWFGIKFTSYVILRDNINMSVYVEIIRKRVTATMT